MDVSILLLSLLIGAVVTYFSGDKLASKVALLFSLGALVISLNILYLFVNGGNVGILHGWITLPKVSIALYADGLSLAMVLLTTILTPLIIFSSFGTTVTNAKNFYALVLFMAFAMTGTFLAADGLLYYVLIKGPLTKSRSFLHTLVLVLEELVVRRNDSPKEAAAPPNPNEGTCRPHSRQKGTG